jgi:hypothetical protein
VAFPLPRQGERDAAFFRLKTKTLTLTLTLVLTQTLTLTLIKRRWLAGACALDLAAEVDFPPCLVLRQMLKHLPLSLSRQARPTAAGSQYPEP